MLYKLTNSAINNEELTKIARDEIDALGRKLNESAILSCIKNDKRVVLYNTVPDRELIVRTNVDKSIYSANTRRVIIANYTPAHLEKCLIRQGMPQGVSAYICLTHVISMRNSFWPPFSILLLKSTGKSN